MNSPPILGPIFVCGDWNLRLGLTDLDFAKPMAISLLHEGPWEKGSAARSALEAEVQRRMASLDAQALANLSDSVETCAPQLMARRDGRDASGKTGR